MSTHSDVKVWYMSEEERLAYIAKHPIIPTEKTKGSTFSDIHAYGERRRQSAEKSKQKKPTVMDSVDKDDLHRRFLAGERLTAIADALSITEATLNAYIKKQREIEPDKWPCRDKKGRWKLK